MATWNFRVVRHTQNDPLGVDPCLFTIHECWYEDDNPSCGIPSMCTVEPTTVLGSNLDELRWQFERMLECLNKPVLEYRDDGYAEAATAP